MGSPIQALPREEGPGEVQVGVGLRRPHFEAMAQTSRKVDVLEFVPENFVGFGGSAPRALEACGDRWSLRPHAVATNLGGVDPLDVDWLGEVGRFLDQTGAECFSDHACFTAHAGVQSMDLLPLPWSDEAAEHLGNRSRRVSEILGRPMLLENITTYARMPGSVLSEGTWLKRVLDVSGARLLLDLNNLYLNAINHAEDPWDALDAIPMERVGRIHLAGHSRRDDLLMDDHAGPVSDPVLALYLEVIRRRGPVETILEWDQRIPDLDTLLDEADRIREAASKALDESLAEATP